MLSPAIDVSGKLLSPSVVNRADGLAGSVVLLGSAVFRGIQPLPQIKLVLGTAAQAVEVSARAQGVDTATAEAATTVSQAQIANLPVLGRQISNLFVTQAGVTQNLRQNTVINGMRPSYSNLMMDGVNVQDSVRLNDLDLIPNKFTIAQAVAIRGKQSHVLLDQVRRTESQPPRASHGDTLSG